MVLGPEPWLLVTLEFDEQEELSLALIWHGMKKSNRVTLEVVRRW